jgi:hypothetical protein
MDEAFATNRGRAEPTAFEKFRKLIYEEKDGKEGKKGKKGRGGREKDSLNG